MAGMMRHDRHILCIHDQVQGLARTEAAVRSRARVAGPGPAAHRAAVVAAAEPLGCLWYKKPLPGRFEPSAVRGNAQKAGVETMRRQGVCKTIRISRLRRPCTAAVLCAFARAPQPPRQEGG